MQLFMKGKVFWGKYPLFIAIITLGKLLFMGLFSSDYQNLMFMPFVSHFLLVCSNQYTYYYLNNLEPSFPYPPLMLIIKSIPAKFLSPNLRYLIVWSESKIILRTFQGGDICGKIRRFR